MFKLNSIKTLLSRAKHVCSTITALNKEFWFLVQYFHNNGYPKPLVYAQIRKFIFYLIIHWLHSIVTMVTFYVFIKWAVHLFLTEFENFDRQGGFFKSIGDWIDRHCQFNLLFLAWKRINRSTITLKSCILILNNWKPKNYLSNCSKVRSSPNELLQCRSKKKKRCQLFLKCSQRFSKRRWNGRSSKFSLR